MDRQDAIQTLSKIGKISVSYAEDLYDSFFPKPVVPQYVADWYEEIKEDLDESIWEYLVNWDDAGWDDFKRWLSQSDENGAITTLINMHQFGYEVEKEKRYTVRIKGVDGYATHLNENLDNKEWFFASNDEIEGYRIKHTRKELESNGFGWVFTCEGIEVKEVTDE